MAGADSDSDEKLTIIPREDGKVDLWVRVEDASIVVDNTGGVYADGKTPTAEDLIRDCQFNMALILSYVPDLKPLIGQYEDALKSSTCWICGSQSYTYIGTYDLRRNFGVDQISGKEEVHQVECDGCGSAYTLTPDIDPVVLLDCIQNKREMP